LINTHTLIKNKIPFDNKIRAGFESVPIRSFLAVDIVIPVTDPVPLVEARSLAAHVGYATALIVTQMKYHAIKFLWERFNKMKLPLITIKQLAYL
jgi:hypothetical protein